MADLTPDEPYVPNWGNREDNRIAERNGRGTIDRTPREHDAEPKPAKTSGPPLSDAAQAKLKEFEAKILSGKPMDDADLETAIQLGALNLMLAGRPQARALALKLMQDARIKKLAPKPTESAGDAQTPPPTSGLNLPG